MISRLHFILVFQCFKSCNAQETIYVLSLNCVELFIFPCSRGTILPLFFFFYNGRAIIIFLLLLLLVYCTFICLNIWNVLYSETYKCKRLIFILRLTYSSFVMFQEQLRTRQGMPWYGRQNASMYMFDYYLIITLNLPLGLVSNSEFLF